MSILPRAKSDLHRAPSFSGVDISPFFLGHVTSLKEKLSVETDSDFLSFEIVPVSEEERHAYSNMSTGYMKDGLFFASEKGLRISGNAPELKEFPSCPLDDGGFLNTSPSTVKIKFPSFKYNSRLLTTESLKFEDMQPIWEDAIRANREHNVIHFLQALQPNVVALHFLSRGTPEILATVDGNENRVPLHSFGDGTRRFLAFSLLFSCLENGLLLVDEIDTGLHWTVMEDLWRLVIGAARDGDVQVFATTHSYDCIKGLASLLEQEPELAEEVSLQKLERQLDRAVAFGGERLPRAVAHNIELR